jgi:hypothetical protein
MNNVPWYIQRALRNGIPLPGAKLYAYVVNTTIPKVVYADVTLETHLVTPLVANADGLYPQYFLGSGEYTFVETDANGVQNGDPRNYVSTTYGRGPGGISNFVGQIESFPVGGTNWITDPDAAIFRTDGCFCWIIPGLNIDTIQWFKTISGHNTTSPVGKVSIWGSEAYDFDGAVKLAEFNLPDLLGVDTEALDLDVSTYRWIGVACDPGLMDSGVPIHQTGLVLPVNTTVHAPRFMAYVGQHAHNTSYTAFPPIYAVDTKYMMTRWMAVGVTYKDPTP